MRPLLIIFSLLSWASFASAHTASTAYLWLSTDTETSYIKGEWHVAIRDLVRLLPQLDRDEDHIITGRELKSQSLVIQKRLKPYLKIAGCKLKMHNILVDAHLGETYAVMYFSACREQTFPALLTLNYDALFAQDSLHRAIIYWQKNPYLFSPEHSQQTLHFNTSSEQNNWQTVFIYIQQGIWHIWIGLDHWLFLLTLLLPAVLIYKHSKWQAVDKFKPAFNELLKIVTAFTIAHSITLSATILGKLTLLNDSVESLIALSVIIVALNNLYPFINQRRWALAFGFGLLHGFGFASALTELGLSQQSLGLSLVGFNIGVELGQLAIVLGYFPCAYLLRHTLFYQWFFLRIGSISVAILACFWLFERIFNITLILY